MPISDRLLEVGTFYRREARRCLKGRAYLSAAIMEVAALEALLQAMCFLYPADVKKTATYKKKKFRRKRNKALDFSLYQLITIAHELSWFPANRVSWGKRTTLAGFAHEARKLRNFVHSGGWGREKPSTTKFSKGVYNVVLEISEVAASWLIHRVNESLRSRMNEKVCLNELTHCAN